jgi:hypothetical protein
MRKAGDVLASLFNEKFDPAFLKKAKKTAGLFSSWEAITAEARIAAAASHSRISELERGILLIEVEHPGWRQLLQTEQDKLLHAAQSRYPELEIRGIAFRLSRDPQGFSAAAEAPPPEMPVVEPPDPAAPEPAEASPQTGLSEDEAYNALKKQLEESIKRRNKNWAKGKGRR